MTTVRILPLAVNAVSCAASRATAVTRTPLTSLLPTQSSVTPSSAFAFFSFSPPYTPSRTLMTKMETGDLSVATLDDYQQVVGMCRNIYNGLDYVPSVYPHLVQGPGVQSFLYKVNGELVAFFTSLLLDREQSVFFLAVRIKDSLRGQGVFSQLHDTAIKHFSNRKLYPRLLREKNITAYSMAAKGFRLVFRTFRADRVFEASSLSNFTLKASPGQVTALQPEAVTQLFQSDPSSWEHLFPKKQLILAQRPYAVMPENTPAILRSGWSTQFYGMKAGNRGYSLLSAGSYHFCPLGINYEVDIFGSVGRETVYVSWDAGEQDPDSFELTGRKEENTRTTVATNTAARPMSDPRKKADILGTAKTEEDKTVNPLDCHQMKLPKESAENMDVIKTMEMTAGVSRPARQEEENAVKLSENTEMGVLGAEVEKETDRPKRTGRDKSNKQIISSQEKHVFQHTSDRKMKIHRAARPDAVKDHVITHLQRLQGMSHTLSGKVNFSVFSFDVLEDEVMDITQELEAFRIAQIDDGYQLWERDIKGQD